MTLAKIAADRQMTSLFLGLRRTGRRDRATERALHARFAPYRLVGEWFQLTPTTRTAIERLIGAAESVAPPS